jgi:hypothetical protein
MGQPANTIVIWVAVLEKSPTLLFCVFDRYKSVWLTSLVSL